MKRKLLLFLCAFAIMLSFCACGRVAHVQRTVSASTQYTPAEIERAMDEVTRHFLLHFEGCTLRQLSYDEEFSNRYAAANG